MARGGSSSFSLHKCGSVDELDGSEQIQGTLLSHDSLCSWHNLLTQKRPHRELCLNCAQDNAHMPSLKPIPAALHSLPCPPTPTHTHTYTHTQTHTLTHTHRHTHTHAHTLKHTHTHTHRHTHTHTHTHTRTRRHLHRVSESKKPDSAHENNLGSDIP